MLKMISTFIVFFVIVHIAVMMWRDLTQKEKWSALKGFAISGVVACFVIIFLSLIVPVF